MQFCTPFTFTFKCAEGSLCRATIHAKTWDEAHAEAARIAKESHTELMGTNNLM